MLNDAFTDELLKITKLAMKGWEKRLAEYGAKAARIGRRAGGTPRPASGSIAAMRVSSPRVVKKSYKPLLGDKHGYDRWDFPRIEMD